MHDSRMHSFSARHLRSFLLFLGWPLAPLCAASPPSGDLSHDHHSHSDSVSNAGALVTGADVERGGFFEPFQHRHRSSSGTPMVHPLTVEPALTGRDLFLDYRFRSGEAGKEHELELELEWAITRRLGFLVELPYIFEREDGEPALDGFGDLIFVPRVLVHEGTDHLMTLQLEVVMPTGRDGLGGETALAPGIVTWINLGDWWALNTQIAWEHVFEEDENFLNIGLGLTKTLGHGNSKPGSGSSQFHETGLTSLLFEATGTVNLSGEGRGEVEFEGLLGVTHGLQNGLDLRLGLEFPITSPRSFDYGILFGAVWHF